jgi:uncharacterized protein (DUF488 family)
MPTSILTVGYASRSIDDFVALMGRDNVEFVIDVRSNPLSKFKPEFSGNSLSARLQREKIRYVFMGDTLGGRPTDPSCYENGHVIYTLVRDKDFFRAGIDRLLNAIEKGFRVCALCSEARPEDCHRSKMIGVSLSEQGANVIHIGPTGEYLTQADVMARLTSVQGILFDASLCSRRAYRIGIVGSRSADKILPK